MDELGPSPGHHAETRPLEVSRISDRLLRTKNPGARELHPPEGRETRGPRGAEGPEHPEDPEHLCLAPVLVGAPFTWRTGGLRKPEDPELCSASHRHSFGIN